MHLMAAANAQKEELGLLTSPLEQIQNLEEELFILNLMLNFEPTRRFVIELLLDNDNIRNDADYAYNFVFEQKSAGLFETTMIADCFCQSDGKAWRLLLPSTLATWGVDIGYPDTGYPTLATHKADTGYPDTGYPTPATYRG
ncbi:hypothetical protein OUZ56_016623 [Daphnia magna]|uniref:Uncharacterized protein n=1 Tax=Daphnia magna TaxID=35525 RepID=A0ABR0AR59_9CRUS|nr:hypothetical protein OUZ56_016623 [Daphnia magna]